ncbi:MAG: ComF family protein [bacterium]|nr:ComF family protein [bacterium]MCX7917867.1 ComF family protein [bacterium]MDW8164615.1 ComF family protein [Candidatus Omnitrophota bacterium]
MCLIRNFFKRKCISCEKEKEKKYGFCDDCFSKIIFINETYKDRIHIGRYEGPLKEAIIKYKYKRRKSYAKYFTLMIEERIIKENIDFDIIIPVPLHWKKEFIRGFNQSALLGNYIAKKMGKIMYQNILLKSKNTISQTELSGKDREENVKGSFKLKNSELLSNKVVLLIDDVYTTGATTQECKKLLLKSGSKKVIIITLAKS